MSSGHYCDDCHQNYLHCTCGRTALSERLSDSYHVQEQEAFERIKHLESVLECIILTCKLNIDKSICAAIKSVAEEGLKE